MRTNRTKNRKAQICIDPKDYEYIEDAIGIIIRTADRTEYIPDAILLLRAAYFMDRSNNFTERIRLLADDYDFLRWAEDRWKLCLHVNGSNAPCISEVGFSGFMEPVLYERYFETECEELENHGMMRADDLRTRLIELRERYS